MEKRFLESIEEVLHPSHVAVIVIDVQNDFCSAQGVYGIRGIDVENRFKGPVGVMSRLLSAARSAKIPLLYVAMENEPNFDSDSSVQRRYNRRTNPRPNEDVVYTIRGSWGAEIIPALRPLPGEPIVHKHRSSAFWGTDLDMRLRSHRVRTLVVCGVTTEGCVESTARDGMFNDYHVVVVEDAVGSFDDEQHAASMVLMRRRFDVLTEQEIEHAWESQTEHSRRKEDVAS